MFSSSSLYKSANLLSYKARKSIGVDVDEGLDFSEDNNESSEKDASNERDASIGFEFSLGNSGVATFPLEFNNGAGCMGDAALCEFPNSYDKMVQCDTKTCQNWLHYKCAGMNSPTDSLLLDL